MNAIFYLQYTSEKYIKYSVLISYINAVTTERLHTFFSSGFVKIHSS